MNIYLISQKEIVGWDTFDSAVVAALTAKKARETHPSESSMGNPWKTRYPCWATIPKKVTAKLIGKAKHNTEAGIICASFNAG